MNALSRRDLLLCQLALELATGNNARGVYDLQAALRRAGANITDETEVQNLIAFLHAANGMPAPPTRKERPPTDADRRRLLELLADAVAIAQRLHQGVRP
jgi:hypothetical protein